MLRANKNWFTHYTQLFWITVSALVFFYTLIDAQVDSSEPLQWKGREVFQQKGCIQCHAIYGKGGKGGPDLGKRKYYGSYLELAALMWNHFPKMFKKMQKKGFEFKEFNEEEMTQLIAYISFIRYMGEPGNENTGRKLLKSKGCKLCHKFGGKGGDIGPDISKKKEYLSPLAIAVALWNHGPEMREVFEEKNIKRPELKGNDIFDITAAIRSYMSPTKVPVGSFDLGDPKIGQKLIKEKKCILCHSVGGVGGNLSSDFIDIDFNCSVTQIAEMMWNHGPKMWDKMESEGISYPTFKESEMADLIAYLYSLKLEDKPGEPARGDKLVEEKGCLSCHSVNGKGKEIAADFTTLGEMDSPISMITAMWNHAPDMQEEHQAQKKKWPRMDGKDMADLYAFLRQISSQKEDRD